MDITILAAIVSALATVIAAIIAIFLRSKKRPDIRLVDAAVIEQPEGIQRVIKGKLIECKVITPQLAFPYRTDPHGTSHFFPIIDLKFKNSGDDVAFLKRVEFKVSKIQVDTTPILEFYVAVDEGDNLVITMKNCGWGPALAVRLDNLQVEKLRECLNLTPKEYYWEGRVEPEEVVNITLPKDAIRERIDIQFTNPCGYITYRDLQGNEYGRTVRYDPYSFEDYTLGISGKGFLVKYRDWARAREPSCRYSVILPTEPEEYSKVFHIAHQIDPMDTERFQLVLAYEKSATAKLVIAIHFDERGIVQTKPFEVKIHNPNPLWYYNYLKPSWVDDGQSSFGTHRRAETLVRRVFSEFGEPYPEIYLHGEQIIEVKKVKRREKRSREEIDSSAWAFNDIGWTLIEQEMDVDEGIRLAKKALKLKPNEPFILDTLGWGYYKKGEYREALDLLRKAHRGAPRDEIINDHLLKAQEATK